MAETSKLFSGYAEGALKVEAIIDGCCNHTIEFLHGYTHTYINVGRLPSLIMDKPLFLNSL